MQKNIAHFIFLLFISISYGQVGIGTTTPSPASMLEVSPTSDGGSSFRGFMPPVMTIAQRNLINTSTTDAGLLVFINDSVEGIQCLQFFTGTTWVCTDDPFFPGYTVFAAQDFDANTTWNYTLSPVTYNEATLEDIWAVVSELDNITDFTGNFLGCSDLDNPIAGPNVDHQIVFDNIDISAATAAKVSFDYDIFEFDTGDSVSYELFYDDVSQGVFTVLAGNSDASLRGTVTINIPATVVNVRITVIINQNGNEDKAGFDNFRVFE